MARKRKKNLIVHVYYGTAGNNGIYIKETINAIRELDCDVKAFVNAYYLFDDSDCKKIFFKHTEFMARNRFRKYFKYLEMVCNFDHVEKEIEALCKQYEEVKLVYSLNECYRPVFRFLKKIKKISNLRLGILVHDIIPFSTAYMGMIYVSQKEILDMADFFVVHNNYTYSILDDRYKDKQILKYRFPLLDLTQIPNIILQKKEEKKEITFLFLGFLRKEKGIEILLNAWEKIEKQYSHIKLVIAGKIPAGVTYDFSRFSNLKQIDKYLTDEEYGELIQQADYGILPYVEGTNSGVLSTISCFGKPCVTSDLPMFKESYFTIPELFFSSGDADDLARVMGSLIENYKYQYISHCEEIDVKLKNYKRLFLEEACEAYREIIV